MTLRSPLGLITAAMVALSGCATNVPEPSTDSAEATEAWPGSVWEAPLPPSGDLAAPQRSAQPRASTFAGVPNLPEPFYSNDQLRRNFLSIAMRAEAADDIDLSGNIAVAKWVVPLRYELVGATPEDVVRITALTMRVRRLTGIDIAPSFGREPNVRLSFVPFRTRNNAINQLAREASLGPSVGGMVVRWRDTEREKCLGLISLDPVTGAIAKADILIKDELPPRIRNACIVEEMVQSLGLMNDDPRARPSIFNDSQEYLDLTSHDEFLLRILYDPRVRPGMSLRRVLPLVDQIIREVRPVPQRVGVKA